jgi:hypothetical protein
MCGGVEEVVRGPIGHRMMHPEATVDRPERYRSSDADDRDVVAIGAADIIDRAQGTNAVRAARASSTLTASGKSLPKWVRM